MILVGLGSNLPFLGRPSEEVVSVAIGALSKLGRLERVSSLYRSPAWPNDSDPPFVNAVAAISVDLAPLALLGALGGVEAGFGRRRGGRNEPRTLDLDLLDYEARIWVRAPRSPLELPHPRLSERDFVLAPIAEIAPEWRHPVSGLSARALLSRLPADRTKAISAVRTSFLAAQ